MKSEPKNLQKSIEIDTLREWLNQGEPVTVLDVRSADDRQQWFIPGSIHVDAYEALKSGNTDALTHVSFPADVPVVTVCNMGRVSQIAAQQLQTRGVEAMSLIGGMKAWSLAWNTAATELPGSKTTVIQIRRTGKGCLSYLLGSAKSAVVIDPSLPVHVYRGLAEERSWTIEHVVETHVHADHLSRAKELAETVRAELWLPIQDRVHFDYSPIRDNTVIPFGTARLQARSTPGHTLESTCYRLGDEVIFTGDTLFTAGVGRPDLHADVEEARRRAGLLFNSIQRIRQLQPEILVMPAHTSQPVAFDGKLIAAKLHAVFDQLRGWPSSESGFVDALIAKLPAAPPNYAMIVEYNESGRLPAGDPTDLEAGANRCAVS